MCDQCNLNTFKMKKRGGNMKVCVGCKTNNHLTEHDEFYIHIDHWYKHHLSVMKQYHRI